MNAIDRVRRLKAWNDKKWLGMNPLGGKVKDEGSIQGSNKYNLCHHGSDEEGSYKSSPWT